MNEKFEQCVICGIETNVNINTHIDKRNNYIEGAGQLCFDCAEEIVGEHVMFTPDEMIIMK